MTYKSNLLNSSSSIAYSPNVALANMPSLMMVNPDTEPIIEIDADLRKIIIPTQLQNIGVVGDHHAEEIFFQCPRYFDGKDLSKHTCIIRCINAGGEYFESQVVDMLIEDDILIFGWILDDYATRYSGEIQFTVQFETINGESRYQWQTTPASLTILAGLNVENTITEKDDTLFRTLTNQIQDLQHRVSDLENMLINYNDLQNEITTLQNEINYLKDNVIYAVTSI